MPSSGEARGSCASIFAGGVSKACIAGGICMNVFGIVGGTGGGMVGMSEGIFGAWNCTGGAAG